MCIKKTKKDKKSQLFAPPALTATYLDLRRGAGGVGALVRAVAVAVRVIPLQLAFAWATFQVGRCKTRQVLEQQYRKQNQVCITATNTGSKTRQVLEQQYRKQKQMSITATIQEAKTNEYYSNNTGSKNK